MGGENGMSEQINPDLLGIISKCERELDIKFPDYGNSWMNEETPYWLKRIQNELDEYEKSMNKPSAKRKLLNIINMAAMAYDNLEKGRMQHE